MNGVTKRCISIGRGDKDPLKRVNYEFGLVLGVDEFIAEQCYFLEKVYAENRALHGCGTVSGLHVSVGPNGDDIEVRVSPGMGIDQYGRMFIVSKEQCASLLAWLEGRDLDVGEHTIFVTARYNECLTDLVPIAGQPCANSDDLNGASRIKDIFDIDLTLDRPLHAAYDGVINLAEFLSRFRVDVAGDESLVQGIIDNLPNIIGPNFITRNPSNYAEFITEVASTLAGVDGTEMISIPPQEAETLRDAIFVYWVTEARPTLLPDVLDPDAPVRLPGEPEPQTLPPDILLARVDLTISDSDALELDDIQVNNDRPYLLHTQLIQELFRFPELATASEATPVPPNREFVSIYANDAQSIRLWIHVGQDIVLDTLQAGLTIFRIGSDGARNEVNFEIQEETDRANAVGRYYIVKTNERLADSDYLLFIFDTTTVQIEVPTGRVDLRAFIKDTRFTYINYAPNANELFAYHIVHQSEGGGITREEVRELIIAASQPVRPTVPFVTITPITARRDNIDFLQGYEFWFHLDGQIEANEGVVEVFDESNLIAFIEIKFGDIQRVPMRYSRIRPNVWMGQFTDTDNVPLPLVRFAFVLDAEFGFNAFNPERGDYEGFSTLRDYIESTEQIPQGHLIKSEEFGEVLVRYVREQASARVLSENG